MANQKLTELSNLASPASADIVYLVANPDTTPISQKTTLGAIQSAVVRGPTVLVAASDAPSRIRAVADYSCDGIADNVEIQSAINSFSASGGIVELSPGTFTIASTIILKSYDTLRGSGKSTMIRAADSLNMNVISSSGVNTEQLSLLDFSLDGNRGNQSSGGGILFDNTGILFPPDPSFTLTDAHNIILNLFVHDCWGDGIGILGNSGTGDGPRETHISSTEAYRCNGNGFTIQAPDAKLVDCIAGNCGLRGFLVGGNAGNAQITSCKAFGAGASVAASGQGFRTTSTGLMFVNCQAQDNKDSGFQIAWLDTILVGCFADSNGQTTNRRAGFEVTGGDVNRVTFTGCYSRDRFAGAARVQDYGFYVASATGLNQPNQVYTSGCYTYNNVTASAQNSGGSDVSWTGITALV